MCEARAARARLRVEPPVHRGRLAEARGKVVCERALREAPVPVALGAGGRVHARLRAEAQHVLQLRDRERGDRHLRGADEVPMYLRAVRAEVLQTQLALAPL